jgi:hypothetical protein
MKLERPLVTKQSSKNITLDDYIQSYINYQLVEDGRVCISIPTTHPRLDLLDCVSALLLTPPNALSHLLLEGHSVLPPLLRGINIRGTLIIGIIQHRYHTHQNGLHSEYGPPALLGLFLRIHGVFSGRVEDRDADFAILVHVGVPHLREEGHGGWHVGEIRGKDETGFEEAAFVQGAVGTHYEDFPVVDIRVIG